MDEICSTRGRYEKYINLTAGWKDDSTGRSSQRHNYTVK
jgi:hypothetical protein